MRQVPIVLMDFTHIATFISATGVIRRKTRQKQTVQVIRMYSVR